MNQIQLLEQTIETDRAYIHTLESYVAVGGIPSDQSVLFLLWDRDMTRALLASVLATLPPGFTSREIETAKTYLLGIREGATR